MTRFARLGISLALTVTTLGLAGAARAQNGTWAGPTFEIAAHGGVLAFSEGGAQPAYGARVGLHLANGIGIGAAIDRADREYELGSPDDTRSAESLFYAGEISYTIPSATRAHFFAFVGVGRARLDPSPQEELIGLETEDHLLIPLGLGMLWTNHGGDPWWAIRAEARDHIVHVEGDEDAGTDDSTTNHYQLSIGLALLLGGGPQPVD